VSLDLRKTLCEDAVARVAYAFAVQFDSTTEVRKRRSIGWRTDRDTWVRIEARAIERIDGQGFNGPEVAAVIEGVAKPEWYQAVSWLDHDRSVMWRADESQLIEVPSVRRGASWATDPNELSDAWWITLTGSLWALAGFPTTRVATPTMQPITEERLTKVIHKAFPDVDTTVDEWTTAHGDLFWTNLTAPACWLLDWEDWGRAPRGYDAASLWHDSLAMPAIAERVVSELKSELDTRSGKLCQLMRCVETITAPPGYADDLLPVVTEHAHRLVAQLSQPA
jgi:hypothetical protein